MRCDQCRHWGDESQGWESDKIGFRRCLAVRERWNIEDEVVAAVEDRTARIDARSVALRASRAFVQDGSDYAAALITGPDFGCVLFTPK